MIAPFVVALLLEDDRKSNSLRSTQNGAKCKRIWYCILVETILEVLLPG
jgi:hypothetical protein